MFLLDAMSSSHLNSAIATPASGIRLVVDSSGVGGIERHVAVLTKALRRRGYDAQIILLSDHGDNAWLRQLEAEQIPYEINSGGTKGLFQKLAARGIGLVHTHGYKADIIGRLVARVLGTPIVSTFHAGETGHFPVNVYQWADEWTSLLGTRISVSAPIAERLPYESRLISNFVVTPDGPPADALPPTVGFVGRLSREKGPDYFCRAAAASPPGVRWVMFGDGPMRDGLERKFAHCVEFRGMISNIAEAWPEIGLLLIPSRAEGLPMAALEALAAGVPVASARVGAMSEVVREDENGWLFDRGHLYAIGRIVARWAAERTTKSREWRAAAWKTAHERFGVDAGLDRTLEAYQAAGFRGRVG